MYSWPADLLDHIHPAAGPAFAAVLREQAAGTDFPHPPWNVATLAEERGLEVWIGWLGLHDRAAYVTAAAAAARYAYPRVVERAGQEALACGLHDDAIVADGASEGQKLRRVEAWLAAPSATALAEVEAAVDPSRQLEIWDDDIRPPDDAMWWWFLAVGELTARAVTHDEDGGIGRPGDPHTWPAPVCAARAAVCALRAIRVPGGDVGADAAALGRAVAAAFGLPA